MSGLARIGFAAALSSAVALALACATTPKAPEGPPPELTSQELTIEQDITTFVVTLSAVVQSAQPATVEHATWEMVVDGKVVSSGDEKLQIEIPAGGSVPVELKAQTHYVSSADELKTMSARGGSLLAAMRGKLFVKQGKATQELDFARGREVRTPRLPSVKLQSLDAARYSEKEANILFQLGLVNPNPFQLGAGGISYKIEVAGKQVAEGVRALGDKVAPASTAVYDISVPVDENTFGPDVKKLIKSQQLPWVITGELKGDLYTIPFKLDGTVILNVSK